LLERKQQVQSGGKRSTIRSWKTYYTVLSGQLLCFFKDEHDFKESKAASSPILIHNAQCEPAKDYTKKKYVIRLITTDSSEYLFDAYSEENQRNWMDKLASSSAAAPSESFRLSMQNDQQGGTNNHQQFQRNLVSEPLYENVQQQQFSNDHLNSSPENRLSTHQGHSVEQPKASPDSRTGTLGSDNSCSESIDSRTAEHKKSKLTKFWGRKHKVPTWIFGIMQTCLNHLVRHYKPGKNGKSSIGFLLSKNKIVLLPYIRRHKSNVYWALGEFLKVCDMSRQ